MGENNDKALVELCKQGDNSCAIFQKYHELCLELDSLQEQVRQDHLTGLYNHQYMKFILEQEIERTKRTQLPTTFILLDIDHFKTFNDQYGHVIGDKVLVHLAHILKSNVRKIDLACRYGGEEFAIILPTTPPIIGIQVAKRIRATIENTPLELDDQSLSITASMGVDSFFDNSKDNLESFIARVDSFLYKAKENGRNQVQHAIHAKEKQAVVSEAEKEALFDMESKTIREEE